MISKNKKHVDNDFDKSSFFKIIVITLLIVIIVLLLLNSCSNLTKTNKGEYTGNYDIYEIALKGTCECPTCKTCNNTCDSTTVGKVDDNLNTDPSNPSTDYEPTDETGFIVYDKEAKWNEEGEEIYQPSIFKHSSYEVVDGLLAPGVDNTYKFIVRNLNDFSVKYTIKAIENNPKSINMKYRLKNEITYLIGSSSHWVDGDEIETTLKSLSAKGRDTYYLDWKWFDDDNNDTSIGIEDTTTYSIYLKIEAEEE